METINPLIQTLRLPGETVTLPSRALFYKNNEVDSKVCQTGEIYVQPMTTYEEILMKTPDLLYTGQSIVQTFARCIPQINNPLELLAADVDFLLVVLRKVSLGSEVQITYIHDCETAVAHEYNVNISNFIRDTKSVDQSTILSSFVHTLPNGQEVHLRPYLLKDVLSISQLAVSEPRQEDTTDIQMAGFLANLTIEGIRPAIAKVVITGGTEVTSPEFIQEWVEALPIKWVQEMSKTIEKANQWGVDVTAQITCTDCGEVIKVPIPLNPQRFFTLPSGPETQN